MALGLFEALGEAWESIRGFFAGTFGRAAEEGIEWPSVSEALTAGGLEVQIPELEADFDLQVRQASIAEQIAELRTDYLIPEELHVETDRLLPTKYAYEVEITFYNEAGEATSSPYYVGSDHRLTQDEILETADQEADESPPTGSIVYVVGGIEAAWVVVEEL